MSDEFQRTVNQYWDQRYGADDFPGGYFACCGMSRARGHAELCHRAAQVGRNAKRQDPQGLGPKDEHAVAEGDAPNPSTPKDPQ